MKCDTNCSALQPVVRADPDVAGIGVLISFIVVAWLTVITCLIWWYIGLVEHAAHSTFSFPIIDRWFGDYFRSQSDTWLGAGQRSVCRNVLRALVLAFSDQQLITGIALLATGQLKLCQITVYHYRTVILLAVVSTVVHSLTMQVLREFMLQRPLLIILRVSGMVIHVILLWLSGYQSVGSLFYPVSCGFISSQKNTVLTSEIDDSLSIDVSSSNFFYPIILTSLGLNFYNFICLIISWISKMSRRANVTLPAFVIKIVSALKIYQPLYIIFKSFLFNLVLAFFVLISATILIFKLREQVKPYLDGSEDDWGFGQIMPNILLLIGLFATLETICDEVDSRGRWYSWLLQLPQQAARVTQRNGEGGEELPAHEGEEMQAQPPLRDADQGRIHSQAVAPRLEGAEFRPRRNDTEARYDLGDEDTRSLLIHNGRDMTMASSSRQPREDLLSEETLRADAALRAIEADINDRVIGELWDDGDLGDMPLASSVSTALAGASLPSRLAASASAAVHTVEATSLSSAVNFQNINEPPSRRTTFERDSAGTGASLSSTIDS